MISSYMNDVLLRTKDVFTYLGFTLILLDASDFYIDMLANIGNLKYRVEIEPAGKKSYTIRFGTPKGEPIAVNKMGLKKIWDWTHDIFNKKVKPFI
jgi:hypothetical protein